MNSLLCAQGGNHIIWAGLDPVAALAQCSKDSRAQRNASRTRVATSSLTPFRKSSLPRSSSVRLLRSGILAARAGTLSPWLQASGWSLNEVWPHSILTRRMRRQKACPMCTSYAFLQLPQALLLPQIPLSPSAQRFIFRDTFVLEGETIRISHTAVPKVSSETA